MDRLSHYTTGYYERDVDEYWFQRHGLLRPDQLAAVCYAFGVAFQGNDATGRRDPGHIVSIGCGAGVLEATLEGMGLRVTGVDPSPGARELYAGRELVDEYMGGGDTIVFVESIEHIPAGEFDVLWERVPIGARVIVTNWPTYHPIAPSGDGWDHVTEITDAVYERLAKRGTVAVRNGSHLVIDINRVMAGG